MTDIKWYVVLVLGFAIIGLAGYYLLVVVPQQELLYLQFQQQVQEAQIQTAIAYCNSIGQQYNFGTGACDSIPIQNTISDWLTDAVSGVFGVSPVIDNTIIFVTEQIDNVVDFWNPFDQSSIWQQAWTYLWGS